jgi:hypothetical protein
MSNIFKRFVFSFLICLALPALSFGQQVTGAITGLVTDPSGAAIANAAVVATDLARHTVWPTQTNNEGFYNLPRLPVGSYDIRVQVTGFQTTVHPPVQLELNQTARVDLSLSLGAVTDTVTVNASAPLMQTETTMVNTVINSTTNIALPLATRNYIQLTLLAPGSVTVDPSSMSQGKTAMAAGRPYINGNREQANNFILDGMDNNEWGSNYVAYTPSVDAIEQFNLITNNASAEFGNFQGGLISTSIKSGTNQYHGNVFEFLRNDKLNANSWSNNFQNLTRNPLRWNMFGGTFGGPIKKNKLFFFADYQGERFDHPSDSGMYTVYTTAERTGDFSQLLSQKGVQLFNRISSSNKPPYPNNIIPLSLMSTAARNLFASPFYPKPTNSNLVSNTVNSSRSYINADQGDVKVDYNVSERDHIFGRFSKEFLTNPSSNSIPVLISSLTDNVMESGVINWTRTVTPNIVNEARFGMNHVLYTNGDSAGVLGNFGEALGIPGANDHGPGLLRIVMGDQTVNSFGDRNLATREGSTAIQASDGLIISRGRHIIHTGFELIRTRQNLYYAGNNGAWGDMNFGSRYTGSSASDFFVGKASEVSRGFGSTGTSGERSNILGAYLQDDIRLTDTLTVNLGLRYENHLPMTEVKNRWVNYDLWTGQPQFAGKPNVYGNNSLYMPYNLGLDFQPRLGFAWSPKEFGGKTVIRGGYTLSSYFEGTGINLRLSMNAPFVQPEYQYYYYDTGGPILTTGGMMQPNDPYHAALIRAWDPTLRPAAVQQWNFTIQHQFSNSLTLQAGYVGQHGTHLVVAMPYSDGKLNADGTVSPSPYLAGNPDLLSKIGAVLGTASIGVQKYDALQAVLQKKMTNGLLGQLSYTYSKCMTDSAGFWGTSGGQGAASNAFYSDPYNTKLDMGPCYWDVKHVLTGYAVYELPFGKGKKFGNHLNRVAQAVAGNWQAGAILTLRGGFPLTVVSEWSSYDPGTGSSNYDQLRPDCLGPVSYPKTQVSSSLGGGLQWFNPSNYTLPAAGKYGSCGTGIVRSAGDKTIDFNLQKQFAFGETRKLEFRAEAINLTNTPILNQPSVTMGNKLGVIQSAQGERNIQLALKFLF